MNSVFFLVVLMAIVRILISSDAKLSELAERICTDLFDHSMN